MSAVRLVDDIEHRATLLSVAESAIGHVLAGGEPILPGVDGYGPELTRPAGTFVTLERDGRLLGCVGSLDAHRPLVSAVAAHALHAAFADPRVPPVTVDDYVAMSVKVSVLSPLEDFDVHDLDELRAALEPGVDGVYVEAAGRAATFLPSVWPQLPDVDGFLDALWRKAGLPPRTWPRGTRVRRYRTDEITGRGPRPEPERR